MSDDERFDLVGRCREAQRRYFRRRDNLAECKELIDLYDPSSGNRKQLETFMQKIAERRLQLQQQLLDIEQMQLELDTAEERCHIALSETL